jgi:hypothetical protein
MVDKKGVCGVVDEVPSGALRQVFSLRYLIQKCTIAPPETSI